MPMPRPAIFFDRDNTLIVSSGYLGDPRQVALISGAAEAIARLRRLGYAIVVCSNQSGVARGYFNEDAVRAVNQRMEQLLVESNPAALIDRQDFCPFHPEAKIEAYRQDSPLRKPKPGMLLQAAKALDLDLPRSWMIGDTGRDIDAGHAAGCRTILIRDPTLPSRSPDAEERTVSQPDYVATTLQDAVDYIEQHTTIRDP